VSGVYPDTLCKQISYHKRDVLSNSSYGSFYLFKRGSFQFVNYFLKIALFFVATSQVMKLSQTRLKPLNKQLEHITLWLATTLNILLFLEFKKSLMSLISLFFIQCPQTSHSLDFLANHKSFFYFHPEGKKGKTLWVRIKHSDFIKLITK